MNAEPPDFLIAKKKDRWNAIIGYNLAMLTCTNLQSKPRSSFS